MRLVQRVADPALLPIRIPSSAITQTVNHTGINGNRLPMEVIFFQKFGVLDGPSENNIYKILERNFTSLLFIGVGIEDFLVLGSEEKRELC